MSMTRTNALDYLDRRYADLAALVSVVYSPTPADYGDIIDDALLEMGEAYTDLATLEVEDGLVPDYRLLLRYHALLFFEDKLVSAVDFERRGDTQAKRASIRLAQVRSSLSEAKAEKEKLGYRGEGWSLARLSLDFLEPEVVE